MNWTAPIALVLAFGAPAHADPLLNRQAIARAKTAAEVYAAQITLADLDMHRAGTKAFELNQEAIKVMDLSVKRLQGPEWDALTSAMKNACSNFPPYIEVNPETSQCRGLTGKSLSDCVSSEANQLNVGFHTALAACERSKQEANRFRERVSQGTVPTSNAADTALNDAKAAVAKFVDLCHAAVGAYGMAGMKDEKGYYECVLGLVDNISITDLAKQNQVSDWPTMVCASFTMPSPTGGRSRKRPTAPPAP